MPGWLPLSGPTLCPEVNGIPDCHFDSFITLIHNGITDLFLLASILAVIAFIYAGFKLIAAQGNPSALKEAGQTLLSIAKGYAVILLAWVIVYTITSTLLKPGFFFTP